jgi:hypothetical protein
MNPEDNATRRQHPRLPHVAGVRIRLPGPADSVAEGDIYASLVDVSPEGAHVLAGQEIAPGSLVEIVLHEEIIGAPLSFHGVVRWCRGDAEDEIYSLGVRIEEDDLPVWREVIVQVV